MANINKIRLSGTTYNIEDENASKTVELTQAQYDALATKEPNTYYVITDATAVDMSNYYTKAQTDTALATKQATLVSGTNIKTINNESILGSGNIEIQGGGVTVDSTWVANSTNPVQSKMLSGVISNTFNLGNQTNYVTLTRYPILGGATTMYSVGKINGESIIKKGNDNTVKSFNLVETSAITTSMNSSSTDAQVPSAKAVYDTLGGLKLVSLTQAQYDALSTKDASTIYFING